MLPRPRPRSPLAPHCQYVDSLHRSVAAALAERPNVDSGAGDAALDEECPHGERAAEAEPPRLAAADAGGEGLHLNARRFVALEGFDPSGERIARFIAEFGRAGGELESKERRPDGNSGRRAGGYLRRNIIATHKYQSSARS